MNRNGPLIVAVLIVGLAALTAAGIVAVVWRSRPPVAAQPVARLPGKGNPAPGAPVAPIAAAPFSTARPNPAAEKLPESEAELAAKIMANRWWRKPPTAGELAKFVDQVVETNRGVRFWVDRNFSHEGHGMTGYAEVDGRYGEGPLSSPRIYITPFFAQRPTRHQILSLLADALASAEYRDGAAR